MTHAYEGWRIMSEAAQHPAPTGQRHEGHDVQLGPVVISGLLLIVVTVLVFWLVGWLLNAFTARQAARDVAPSSLAQTRPALPPEPRLQVAPSQELQELRASEEAVLQSYGWVDQAAGIVRLPMARAMELVLERGLPVWPVAPGAAPGDGGSQR
jgi:hypothetical protein